MTKRENCLLLDSIEDICCSGINHFNGYLLSTTVALFKKKSISSIDMAVEPPILCGMSPQAMLPSISGTHSS